MLKKAVVINVVCRHAGTTVAFNNVSLEGYYLGNFSASPNNWNVWSVTNFDFTKGWTLTGEIVLSGTFSGGDEKSKIEIVVGLQT